MTPQAKFLKENETSSRDNPLNSDSPFKPIKSDTSPTFKFK